MSEISKERVGALSDGMVAIAATLLVLELKIPENHNLSSQQLLAWSRIFLGWVISFAMIAIFWFENHLILARVSKCTVPLTVVIFVHLGLLSLIPFGSNLIMDEPQSLAAAITFSVIMMANGVCSALAALMLSRTPEIHNKPGSAELMGRRSIFQMTAYVLVATISVLGAYLHHPFLGVALWLFMPLIVWFWFNGFGATGQSPRRSDGAS